MLEWYESFLCDQAMKRPGRILGSLPFITGLCVAAGWLLPAVAQEPPASSPATTTAAPGAAGDSSGLSEKEKALLQKLNALKTPRWRPFGPCQYDWSAWKLMPEGVRITGVQCGAATVADREKAPSAATVTDSVAVHCDTLKLSIKSADQPWTSWRLPYSATESTARGAHAASNATAINAADFIDALTQRSRRPAITARSASPRRGARRVPAGPRRGSGG